VPLPLENGVGISRRTRALFPYGAWNDSIDGTYERLTLVDSLSNKIDYALIIIDVDNSFIDRGPQPLSGDHYLISKKTIPEYYLMGALNYYRNPLMVLSSIDYSLFHRKRGYMKNFIGMGKSDIDPITNDFDVNSEKKLLDDSVNYFKKLLPAFYKRPDEQRYAKKEINAGKINMLKKIKEIFDKRHTKYKLIISPLYDQIKLNSSDLNVLNEIFGKENVYDYAGISTKTNNIYNYTGNTHFRKKLGSILLKEVYNNKN
jgi:hypothetical protein